jgi:Secretion system C-terminal sorting domain
MNGKFLLFSAIIVSSLTAVAQNANRAYVIAGKANNKFFWADIKQIDLATGKTVNTLFENGVTAFAASGSEFKMNGVANADPMGYGVAACALDSRNDRLYFTPMHFAQLRYIDLKSKSPKFVYLDLTMIAPKAGGFLSEESHITRMVIGADGYGYAVTNDANHFIRFSTGSKPQVTDLGNLVDADGSKVSIHNKCTSWGGDMVADAFGKLYIISANHHVFSIDADSRIATHLGAITGLPANYTTNGAVVNAEGKIVVGSANTFDGYFSFALSDLKAVKVNTEGEVVNPSDMANGNFLLQKEADIARAQGRPVLAERKQVFSDISVYPNPVTGSQFRVTFSKNKPGTYTIVLTDLVGKALMSKVVNILADGQVETVSMKSKPAQGMYLVKVINADKENVSSTRIVID